MNYDRAHDMAIVAAEASSTAAKAIPSESQLHMLTGAFSGKLLLYPYLWYFESRIIKF